MNNKPLPQHRNPVLRRWRGQLLESAFAPYNFVPLPERVVLVPVVVPRERVPPVYNANGEIVAEFPYTVRQDVFHANRFSGCIVCKLMTESPLYVRCALTETQFAAAEYEKTQEVGGQDWRDLAKNTPEFFYTQKREFPVIPGSSLRGMLRALVEIAAYGKVDRVTNRPRYFFRAVAVPSIDPLRDEYVHWMGRMGRNVRAGYLVRKEDGWYIRPAKKIGKSVFLKINERFIPDSFKRTVGFIGLHDTDKIYYPQWYSVSFTTRTW
ncbi:MAG: hypothetical protein HGA19_19265, partial [Oscillochloris sp.]|nr:hypothetical protein [Oscillochloris sp.]